MKTEYVIKMGGEEVKVIRATNDEAATRQMRKYLCGLSVSAGVPVTADLWKPCGKYEQWLDVVAEITVCPPKSIAQAE